MHAIASDVIHRLSRALSRFTSSAYRGAIDGCIHTALQGWVHNVRNPDERPRIHVYVDGMFVCERNCNETRPDLKNHGYGDGRYGFHLPLPWFYLTGKSLDVEVWLSDRQGEKPLLRKSVDVPVANTPELYAVFRGFRLDYAYGWALAPSADETPLELILRVDGQPAGSATACLYDGEAKRMHPALYGFLRRIEPCWLDGEEHELEIFDAASARPLAVTTFSRTPSPGFDPDVYEADNLHVREMDIDPMFHRLVYGPRNGHTPHTAFYEQTPEGVGHATRRNGTRPENNGSLPAIEEHLRAWSSPPKKKLRVVATSHDASRTGAPLIILEFLNVLKRDYDVEAFILILHGGELLDAFKEVGEVLVAESLPPHGLAPDLTRFIRVLHGPDTVALCNSAETLPLMKMISAMGMPTYSLVHEFINSYPDDRFDSLFSASDMVIFPADLVRDSAIARLRLRGTPTEEALVIPQGLLHPALLEDDPAACHAVREEFGISESTFLVLGSGSIDPRKGCDLFVHVAHALKRRGRVKDFAFVWVGQRYNWDTYVDAYLNWLMQDIEAAGLHEHVHFVGGRDDVSPFYAASDAFLMLSRLDPFPCVVLEAMAAKLPVIAFDGASGSTEVLKDGGGICVPFLDLAEVTHQLEHLAGNPDEAHALGQRARERIASDYRFEDYVRKVMSSIAEHSGLPALLEQFPPPDVPHATAVCAPVHALQLNSTP